MHLNRAQSKILRESMSRRDELGHLLNGGTASSLVRRGDDYGEEFGSEERSNALLDTSKAFLEPLGRSLQIRELVDLPMNKLVSSSASHIQR
jgi:hypothetical protein